MNKLKAIFKYFLWLIGVWFGLGMIFFLVQIFSPFASGNDLLLGHFLFGFVPFLKNNIPIISWNAATWGPGLGAFLIAVVMVHRYLLRWAERTGRQWNFATSFCLVMVVPVLFVISFIIPGVLLQWEALRETVWINVW